jgi:hypothetical protein
MNPETIISKNDIHMENDDQRIPYLNKLSELYNGQGPMPDITQLKEEGIFKGIVLKNDDEPLTLVITNDVESRIISASFLVLAAMG